MDGATEGATLGLADDDTLGVEDGIIDGPDDGAEDGSADGDRLGEELGINDA